MDQNYNEYMRCIDETTLLYNLAVRMYDAETIEDLNYLQGIVQNELHIIYKGNCQRIYDTHKIRTFFGKITDRILDFVEGKKKMIQKYMEYIRSEKYAEHLRCIKEIERMLKGNINRMCVTDNPLELNSMQRYAKDRIDQIAELNTQRLRDSGLYE